MAPMQGLNAPVLISARVEHLYVAAGHRFFGRHGQDPLDYPIQEMARVECVAGRGIRGDRFFGHPEGHKGQVTFFSMEVWDALCRELGVGDRPPSVLRRNIFVRDMDLDSLIGCAFSLQGIAFEGVEECRPCYWMDRAFGPGAESFLKGQGGLRARVVAGGMLGTAAS
jgi:MOSC domain-containing protein YiiM